MALAGRIALVTGASRGIGRGIALQLGEAGATVYVTGRKPSESDGAKLDFLPKLEETATEINSRGGHGIASYVDHSNMDEVKAFFEKIDEENNGKLDILVNNAYAAGQTVLNNINRKFFELDPGVWDECNNVGLRNHYYCSVYAARMMHKNKDGLIVNISSAGGLQYIFNVPYGVGKQALDRMAEDMSIELKASNVCAVSLWPGVVRTELSEKFHADGAKGMPKEMAAMFADSESPEFVGKAVVALATDKKRMRKTGRILVTGDLGTEYGFKDIDGRSPPSMRSFSQVLKFFGWPGLGSLFPGWAKLPGWAIWTGTSRL